MYARSRLSPRRLAVLSQLILAGASAAFVAGVSCPSEGPSGPVTSLPFNLSIASGDRQSAPVGLLLPESLVVFYGDSSGKPGPSKTLTWLPGDTGSGYLTKYTSTSSATGKSVNYWVLGCKVGAQVVTVAFVNSPIDSFHATATAPAYTITKVTGDAQSGAPGTTLPIALEILLKDGSGNPVAQSAITWGFPSGGGTLRDQITGTDGAGHSSNTWTLGSAPGPQSVTAGGAGCVSVTFTATAVVAGSAKIYVSDGGNNRIVRVDDLTGTNWTTFGTSGSGIGQFKTPEGVALDAAGKIYVTDGGNNRIVRMDDMNGTNWITLAGSGTNQFSGALGIAVDRVGKIYVADGNNNRIVRIDDMTGTNWTTLGTFGGGTNQFSRPEGIAVDTGGKIYVADVGNNRIVRMDDMAGLNWTTLGTLGTGTNQFARPEGIAVDAGKIYVADENNHRIVRMDSLTGAGWTAFGAAGTGTNQFDAPRGISVAAGKIYVTDYRIARIVRFDDMIGTNWISFGSQGPGTYQFSIPKWIVVR